MISFSNFRLESQYLHNEPFNFNSAISFFSLSLTCDCFWTCAIGIAIAEFSFYHRYYFSSFSIDFCAVKCSVSLFISPLSFFLSFSLSVCLSLHNLNNYFEEQETSYLAFKKV